MAELSDKGRKLLDLAMAKDEPPSADGSWGMLASRLTGEGAAEAMPHDGTRTRGSRTWIWIALAVSAVLAIAVVWGSHETPRPVTEPAEPTIPGTRARPRPAPAAKAVAEPPRVDALLDEAEAALTAGDPDRAMSLLEQHAERAPTDPRAPQRMALRVLVLCAQAQPDQARDEAEAFLAAHADSRWSDAVRRSCAAR